MKKVLIFALIGAFTAALLILPGCTTPGEDMTPIDNNGNPMYETTIYEFPEGITFLSATSSDVHIKATVIPESALNKQVDWAIKWATPDSVYASGKNVTDYVTVTPDADGSRFATVSCYQLFEENIIITVTTRDGGFTAQCVVSFAGVPTGLNIDTGISTVTENNIPVTYLNTSSEYYFDLSLSNDYDSIGEDYDNFTISSYVAYGKMTVQDWSYSSGTWQSGTEQIVYMDDIKEDFISNVEIVSGQLKVKTTHKIPENYMQSATAHVCLGKFKEWDTDYLNVNPTWQSLSSIKYYFEIVVKEQNSRVEDVIYIKVQSGVENVSLSPNEIVF